MQAGMTHRRHDSKCRERMEQALMDDGDEDNDWADRVQRRLDDVTEHADKTKASEPGPAPRKVQDIEADDQMEVEPSPGEVEDPEMNESMMMLQRALLGAIRGVDLTEVYSPERIMKEASKFGLVKGLSMDLLTGWDFDRASDRAEAERHQADAKPLLMVGSPMCTMFSTLQRLRSWNESKQLKYNNAVKHVEWVAKLYQKQHEAGRLFLHEHPAQASSWQLPAMRKLAEMKGV